MTTKALENCFCPRKGVVCVLLFTPVAQMNPERRLISFPEVPEIGEAYIRNPITQICLRLGAETLSFASVGLQRFRSRSPVVWGCQPLFSKAGVCLHSGGCFAGTPL